MEYSLLEVAPAPRPLQNIGSICYWNALMQALISCTSITKALKETSPKGPVGAAYMRLVDGTEESAVVLDTLRRDLRKRGIITTFGSQQESADEGLFLLMDAMPAAAKEMIMHRHIRVCICDVCGQPSDETREMSCHVEMFGAPATSPKEFASVLMHRIAKLDDYICEHCSNRSVYRSEQLSMIPEILVVMFTGKFTDASRPTADYFPEEFVIPSKRGNNMNFRVVATVRHSGGLNSGHYWSVVRRGNRCYLANDSSISTVASITPDPSVFMVFYHMYDNN